MTIWIEVGIKEEFPPYLQTVIENVIQESLKQEKVTQDCEISVSVVDNLQIQEMNRKFRGIDSPTDVLSFPLLTFAEGEQPDKNEKGEILLGDIVISYEKAKQQADEYGHSIEREIGFLTAHSMLHLLGYDHISPTQETEMFQKQEEILNALHITRQN